MDLTETERVARAQAGDEASFTTLMSRHAHRLQSLVRFWIPHNEDADDALQQIYLQAWRDIPKLRDRSPLRYWLHTLAQRCCYQLRRRRRAESELQPLAVEEWSHHRGRIEQRHAAEIEQVRECMDHLNVNERDVLNRFYLDGASVKEIAELRQAPEGTIRRELTEARRHLRRQMGIVSLEKGTEIMSTPTAPTTLDAVLQTTRESLAKEKPAYAALLERDAVIDGIKTAVKQYEDYICNSKSIPYFERIKAMLAEVTEHGRWPAEMTMDWFCEKKLPNGTRHHGLSVGIEIATPNAECRGFSLPVMDLWFGCWSDDVGRP